MSATFVDARGVVARHGDRTVLAPLDLRLAAGDQLALVGDNGTGKSTLLELLAGVRAPDAGTIDRAGTLAFVRQLARSSSDRRTVIELALAAMGVAEASARLRAAETALSTEATEATITAHAEALDAWLDAGGATADADVAAAAERIGLPAALLARPAASLSSGQLARAGLLPIAARRHDVLLLDEPTNHLDGAGRDQLDALLSEHRGALVVASHDRRLLGRHTGRVLLLRPRGEPAEPYAGGWAAFEREREATAAHAQEAYDRAVQRRGELQTAEREIRRRAAATRSRIGGAPRDGDKHVKEWFAMRADGVAARGRVVGERAERVEVPDRPWQERPLALTLTPEQRRAPFVVALEGAVLRRGAVEAAPLDLAVAHGDRILLLGPNGAGKSTLLQALAGSLPLVAGARDQGTGAVVSVLGAVEVALAGGQTVAAVVRELTGLAPADARTHLAQVGLGAEAAARPASSLSPGERTRAELAVLGARRTTCLLLDEPSNHLDLRSLEALEAALDGWPGALVVATHDDRLAERLRPTRVLRLTAWGEPIAEERASEVSGVRG